MLTARSPIDDQELQDALRIARAAQAQGAPHLWHPSGRRLDLDDPNDSEMARSLAIGRAAYAGGGAVERETRATPRFAIPYQPNGLAAGVPNAAPMPEPAPSAAPTRYDGGLDDIIAGALNHARLHLSRGGGAFGSNPLLHAMPGATPLAAAPSARGMLPGGVQPVLSQNLQHGMLHHLLRQRPRFDDGGSAGDGGNSDGGYGSNGNDNYGGSFGGFTAAERAQNAADDAASDADPSTWGGGGGGISRGGPGDPRGASTTYGGSSGWNSAPSSIGFSGGDVSGTTVGNASNQVASLSNGFGGSTNYGGTYGSSPGYSSNGGFNPGSIGGGWSGAETPGSGIASGNGWGGGTKNSSNSGLGFGNFGGSGLGDGGFNDSSAANGVNGTNGWGGLSDGSVIGNAAAGFGYQTPLGATAAGIGSIGRFNTGSSGAYGDLSGGFGGFSAADVQSALAAAQGTSPDSFGLMGLRSAAPSATDGTAASVQGSLFGRTGNWGLSGPSFSAPSFGSGDVGSIPGGSALSTANQPGFDNFGLSDNAMTKSLGVLGDALPAGFASPEIGMQLSPMIGGYTPDHWTPMGAATDMFTHPSDYFSNPALAGFHAAPNFARGALSDANIATGMTNPATAGNFVTNMVGAPTMGGDPDPTGATGMFGLTGPQKTGLLSALGVSSNADSVDTMNALNGTMADQVGYTLGQIASDPQYAAVKKAAINPNLSVAQQANAFATGYQGVDPNDQNAAKQRSDEAQALSSWRADPPVGSPTSPGTTPAASSEPTPANTSWNAATDPSAATALGAAGYATSPDGYSLSPTGTGIYGTMSPAGLHTGAEGAVMKSDAAQQAFSGMPSMVGYDAADHVTKSGASSYSYNDGTEGSDTPAAASTDDEPTPYIQMAVRAAMAVAGGLPGLALSYLMSKGSPGSVPQPGGASGRDGTGNATPTYQPGPSYSYAPSSSTPSSYSSTTPAISTGQQAYLAALKNLPGPGPAARKSNAVPLVAPSSSMAQFYNPLTDPSVLAGLAARGYGR